MQNFSEVRDKLDLDQAYKNLVAKLSHEQHILPSIPTLPREELLRIALGTVGTDQQAKDLATKIFADHYFYNCFSYEEHIKILLTHPQVILQPEKLSDHWHKKIPDILPLLAINLDNFDEIELFSAVMLYEIFRKQLFKDIHKSPTPFRDTKFNTLSGIFHNKDYIIDIEVFNKLDAINAKHFLIAAINAGFGNQLIKLNISFAEYLTVEDLLLLEDLDTQISQQILTQIASKTPSLGWQNLLASKPRFIPIFLKFHDRDESIEIDWLLKLCHSDYIPLLIRNSAIKKKLDGTNLLNFARLNNNFMAVLIEDEELITKLIQYHADEILIEYSEILLKHPVVKKKFNHHQLLNLIDQKPELISAILGDDELAAILAPHASALIIKYPEIIIKCQIINKELLGFDLMDILNSRPDLISAILDDAELAAKIIYCADELLVKYPEKILKHQLLKKHLSSDALRQLIESKPEFLSLILADVDLLSQLSSNELTELLTYFTDAVLPVILANAKLTDKIANDAFANLATTNNKFAELILGSIVCQFFDDNVLHGIIDNNINLLKVAFKNKYLHRRFKADFLTDKIIQSPKLFSIILENHHLKIKLKDSHVNSILYAHPKLVIQALEDNVLNKSVSSTSLTKLIIQDHSIARLVFATNKGIYLKAMLSSDNILEILNSKNIILIKLIFGDLDFLKSIEHKVLIDFIHQGIEFSTLLLQYHHIRPDISVEKIVSTIFKQKGSAYLLNFLKENPRLLSSVRNMDINMLFALFGIDGLLELYTSHPDSSQINLARYSQQIFSGSQEDIFKRIDFISKHTPMLLNELLKIPDVHKHIVAYFKVNNSTKITEPHELIHIKVASIEFEELNKLLFTELAQASIQIIASKEVTTLCHLLIQENIPYNEFESIIEKLSKLDHVGFELIFSVALKKYSILDDAAEEKITKRAVILLLIKKFMHQIKWSSGNGLQLQAFLTKESDDRLIAKISRDNLTVALNIALNMPTPPRDTILGLIKNHYSQIDFDSALGKKLTVFLIQHADLALLQLLSNLGICLYNDDLLKIAKECNRKDLLRSLLADGKISLTKWNNLFAHNQSEDDKRVMVALKQWNTQLSPLTEMDTIRKILLLDKLPNETALKHDTIYLIDNEDTLTEHRYFQGKYHTFTLNKQTRDRIIGYFADATIVSSEHSNFIDIISLSTYPLRNAELMTQNALKKDVATQEQDANLDQDFSKAALEIINDYCIGNETSLYDIADSDINFQSIALAHFVTLEEILESTKANLRSNYHSKLWEPSRSISYSHYPYYSKLYLSFCQLRQAQLIIQSDSSISEEMKSKLNLNINSALLHFKPTSIKDANWQTKAAIPIIMQNLFYDRVKNDVDSLKIAMNFLEKLDQHYRNQLKFWHSPSSNTEIKKIALDNMHRFIQSQKLFLNAEDIKSLYDFVKDKSTVVKYKQFNYRVWDFNAPTRSQIRCRTLSSEKLPNEATITTSSYSLFNNAGVKRELPFESINSLTY